MKQRNFQILISIIPFFSTIIILCITMISLIRQKGSGRRWAQFGLTLFIYGAVISFVDALFRHVNAPVLHAIVTLPIMVMANLCFIYLQSAPERVAAPWPCAEIAGFFNGKHILLIVLIGVILSAYGAVQFWEHNSLSYTDSNGVDDTSLCSISLKEILNTTDDYSATWFSDSRTGEKTDVDGELKDYDYSHISLRCKKIDGIITLQSTKVTDDVVKFAIDSTVKAGNMEIIILIDDEYYCHVDTGSLQSVELKDVAGKTIVVRMASESAEVHIQITRYIGS